ncbi:uncharacterized protein LOC118471637 [Amphiprion ocellaris]|uniref:uncharacterized protein LOC118471637 n=1 Tax=Amphiprion ocellaris TaxID=80972 RepID=UPI0024115FE2|nr:uncharacterized protein LOC118471637 [Amphiprion ocellaris]
MSSERNPEVVSCDASIMKNVWEIRLREYGQKLQLEQERVEKSALPTINQEWANRCAAKAGGYKRTERKVKRPETQPEDNVWKSKPTAACPPLPRGSGSGPQGRAVQSRGFSTPASKDKKVQDKSTARLQLLMSIPQTQPSTMVWGKSWKFSKGLAPPAEGTTNWGHCWMFATQQPWSEAGKPWPNGPNLMDPQNLHFWIKSNYRMVESQELDLDLPAEVWQMSWKKSDKYSKKHASSANGENEAKSGFFTSLVETQHHNQALSSSEWSDSWRATKPANQQDHFADEGFMNESAANKQDMVTEMSSDWKECWKLVNYHGCSNFKMRQSKKFNTQEWVSSWRAAMGVSNNHNNSDSSLKQDQNNSYDNAYLHKSMPMSREHKHTDLYMQLCDDFKALSEWAKSWEVTKNNTKPCEEIEKVLKAPPPKMDPSVETQKMEKNPLVQHSTSEKPDPRYKQLKHDIIYRPAREFTQLKLLLLKHMEKTLPSSEWRDAWQMIKHRMRQERRRMRPNPLNPFGESENRRETRPSASEWKDSWRYTCHPLRQEPEQWQQGWTSTPQIRENYAMHLNHFAPVELPKNGPTGERSWVESWRFSRRQHRSNSAQSTAQTSQGRSSAASHHSADNSRAHRRQSRPVSDWQSSWMVSETQFHHDNPSLTQWREAWQWSVYHTENWVEHVPRENWRDDLFEIQPLTERISTERVKAKMSRSFDNQMFRQRYPEKEWNPSWSSASFLRHQSSHHGSSGTTGQSGSSVSQQQRGSASEYGCKWGRSFRLANPMPQMDQPWVESNPNACYYPVMWSRGKKTQKNIRTEFCNNPTTFKLWGTSHRFLQGTGAQTKDKTKSKGPTDPMVIIPKKSNTRKYLFSTIEKEKQSERKWAGCHLLGKTQPRPKRGSGPAKKVRLENSSNDKFVEEWAESWRFLVQPGSLKKKMSLKAPSGWDEAWKFLVPPYQPMNGPKGR